MKYSTFRSPHCNPRNAFTLIEALIAIAITLIMMLALSKGFALVSENITQGRAKLTLSDQLRGISSILREDLQGMTAGGDPLAQSSQLGYAQMYEGPLNDSTATRFNYNYDEATVEAKVPTSRYGDFDDILAFTAKARNGQWFKGEVPYALVKGAISPGSVVDADWYTNVTVASDTAEIVYYVTPWGADPTAFITTATPPVVDFTLALNPNMRPNLQGNVVDDLTGIPSRMALCRRVLLVLPSLNKANGILENTGGNTYKHRLMADAFNSGGGWETGYRTGMQNAYQHCDLSVRRVPDGDLTNEDPIAANSLDDLQDPRNRFGHVMLPTGNGNTTMPIFALTGTLPLQDAVLPGVVGNSAADKNLRTEAGFLMPQFLRHKRADNLTAGAAVPQFLPSFNEVLATNIVGFDLRGYDETVPLLYHAGPDGGPGEAGTNFVAFGQLGSDDLVLNPADPGYPYAHNAKTNLNFAGVAENYVARRGAFVDLAWNSSLFTSPVAPFNPPKTNIIQPTDWLDSMLHSPLSITEAANSQQTTSAFIKSGGYLLKGGSVQLYQPSFDTYTARYESDGYWQSSTPSAENGNFLGTIWVGGTTAVTNTGIPILPTAIAGNADHGSDGISNIIDGPEGDFPGGGTAPPGFVRLFGGIDGILEQETSPPVRATMKAIQVMIRVQDSSVGAIQQTYVTNELRL